MLDSLKTIIMVKGILHSRLGKGNLKYSDCSFTRKFDAWIISNNGIKIRTFKVFGLTHYCFFDLVVFQWLKFNITTKQGKGYFKEFCLGRTSQYWTQYHEMVARKYGYSMN